MIKFGMFWVWNERKLKKATRSEVITGLKERSNYSGNSHVHIFMRSRINPRRYKCMICGGIIKLLDPE